MYLSLNFHSTSLLGWKFFHKVENLASVWRIGLHFSHQTMRNFPLHATRKPCMNTRLGSCLTVARLIDLYCPTSRGRTLTVGSKEVWPLLSLPLSPDIYRLSVNVNYRHHESLVFRVFPWFDGIIDLGLGTSKFSGWDDNEQGSPFWPIANNLLDKTVTQLL